MPLPPHRPRTPSGHDIPIPESVFLALQDVSTAVNGLAQEVRAGKADTDTKLAEVRELAQKASSQSVERWTNLAKAILPAIALTIGGTAGVQKLTEREPPPATKVVRSQADLDLDECRPLPPGSYERAECFERVSRVTGPRR